MKIAIVGGHLSPALAVMEEIKDKKDILFVGRKYALEGDNALSLEYKICQEKGIAFAPITTGRLQRKFTKYSLSSLLKMPQGFYQARKILSNFHPDVVVAFGGYVSIPIVLAAFAMRIPIVIHEQTLEAGLANKIESKFANRICISFETSRIFFPRTKTILTGNPIRKEIINPKSEIDLPSENIPLIYVTGGSLGSFFINSLIEKNLISLLRHYQIVHQVGSANNNYYLDKLKEIKKTLSNEMRKRYLISDHFSADEVGSIMRKATIVVSRAGINTINELLFLNKAALLIPLPHSQRSEQLKNALFLKEAGLGQILLEDGIREHEFTDILSKMIRNIGNYKLADGREYVTKDAASKILSVVENAANTTSQKTS